MLKLCHHKDNICLYQRSQMSLKLMTKSLSLISLETNVFIMWGQEAEVDIGKEGHSLNHLLVLRKDSQSYCLGLSCVEGWDGDCQTHNSKEYIQKGFMDLTPHIQLQQGGQSQHQWIASRARLWDCVALLNGPLAKTGVATAGTLLTEGHSCWNKAPHLKNRCVCLPLVFLQTRPYCIGWHFCSVHWYRSHASPHVRAAALHFLLIGVWQATVQLHYNFFVSFLMMDI